jgi:hypothetical protein
MLKRWSDFRRQQRASLRAGTTGQPLNRQTPFYVGFVGELGVFAASACAGHSGS